MSADQVIQALVALDNNGEYGKRGTKLWTYQDTVWSYETALIYRAFDVRPIEYYINVTKYTNTTTRLQVEIMRRFNPNTDKTRVVYSVDNMSPLCHGIDLPHTFYELPVEDRYRSNWKMPQGWPRALDEYKLLAHYKRLGHDLTTFRERERTIYTDCCNCGLHLTAFTLYYRGDVRYIVTESKLRSRCEFAEVAQHDA